MQIVHLDLFRWLFSCGACSSDPSTGKGYLNTVSYIWYQYIEQGCVCKSSTMNSWQNIKSDSRLAQLQTLAYFVLMGLVLHLVTYHQRVLITASACGDAGHRQRWWWKWREGAALTSASQNPKRSLTLMPAIR